MICAVCLQNLSRSKTCKYFGSSRSIGHYIIKIRVRDNDLIKEEHIIAEVGDPGSQFLAGVGDLGFQLPNDSDGDCIPDYIEDK